MNLIVKIGCILLLMLLKYQGGEADVVSSVAEKYTSTIVMEFQEYKSLKHSTFDADYFNNSLFTVLRQVWVKVTLDSAARIRRAEEIEQEFLKKLIGCFSLREDMLAIEQAKLFPSNPIHCVSPACHYFVFMLRRILI